MSGERPLRVGFFALLPAGNVATRTFCERPARLLGPHGISGRLLAPSSEWLHRALHGRRGRGWRLRAAVYWYLLVPPRRLLQLAWSIARCDAVLIQRGLMRYSDPPLLERLLAAVGPPIVYHLDDGLWAVARRSHYEARCRVAARVITGNALIADFARSAGGRVEWVEYAVDVARYPVRRHAARTPTIIGYVATMPDEFLPLVAEPLRRVCERTGARVRVVGGTGRPAADGLDAHLDWEPWSEEVEYSLFADLDVAIMPLSDTEHNRGKEPYKIKEYMAAGLPIVASPVGHNLRVVEEGRHGYLPRSPEGWEEALERLVLDPELRQRMGAEGRALVQERWDYPRLLADLARVLREVVEERA